jgi:hypothetical protein
MAVWPAMRGLENSGNWSKPVRARPPPSLRNRPVSTTRMLGAELLAYEAADGGRHGRAADETIAAICRRNALSARGAFPVNGRSSLSPAAGRESDCTVLRKVMYVVVQRPPAVLVRSTPRSGESPSAAATAVRAVVHPPLISICVLVNAFPSLASSGDWLEPMELFHTPAQACRDQFTAVLGQPQRMAGQSKNSSLDGVHHRGPTQRLTHLGRLHKPWQG